MKKVLIIALVCIGAVFQANAQKLGHIDSQELLLAMPERAAIETELQNYASALEEHLNGLKKQYEAKVAEIQSNPNLPEAIYNDKLKELQNLEISMQEFQVTANQDLQKKETELLKPMIDKAQEAINAVAEEQGFTYIIDSSTGVTLYNGGEDIMASVKAKLGIQ
ncbi:MAG: OmpH family outer membrane protein [Flavobacteriales bacterium]|nr:OmpH family outer membrane protein [Flavobacteriales bacterium]